MFSYNNLEKKSCVLYMVSVLRNYHHFSLRAKKAKNSFFAQCISLAIKEFFSPPFAIIQPEHSIHHLSAENCIETQ